MPVLFPLQKEDFNSLIWLLEHSPFNDLTEKDLFSFLSVMNRIQYEPGEIVIQEGETATSAYFVLNGELSLSMFERKTKHYSKGSFFGEIGLIDSRPRMGTICADENSNLLKIEASDLENESRVSPHISAKIYRRLSMLVTTYVRQDDSFYRTMDVLIIQDGGCAPGYNPATAFITDSLEKMDRKVFITAEGFKSIISNHTIDYRCLISNLNEYNQLEHIPGVVYSPDLREARGANFRSERFPEFKSLDIQKEAARNIIERKIRIVIGIGGNGTFAGINSLCQYLPDEIQVFFIPVTIDSDIYGTDCIGEYTGVEIGAEKIRCYMADAQTHKRCYIIEMMGAHGGFHALHSCLGAGAHLAVLPSSDIDVFKVANALQKHKGVVIVVAEGYKVTERKEESFNGNAAEYFHNELLDQKIVINQKIVCESFSRDIRGASPNNLDIMLCQRMARQLAEMTADGKTKMMPAVLSGREYSIPFEEIRTDNSVESSLAHLANKLT